MGREFSFQTGVLFLVVNDTLNACFYLDGVVNRDIKTHFFEGKILSSGKSYQEDGYQKTENQYTELGRV
jgi:hypothetical protein